MRLGGWFLLLAGLLLCLTVAWATVGFLLMGVGLIALRSAERRRQRSVASTFVVDDVIVPVDANAPDETRTDLPIVSLPAKAAHDAGLPQPALLTSSREPGAHPPQIIDTVRWHVLLRKDPEIARLAEILTPYGAGYVEQLASDYLDVGDKSALPAILDRIIARARAEKEEAERVVAPAPVDVLPAETNAEPQRAEAEPSSRREPVFDAPVTATAAMPVVAAMTPAIAAPVIVSSIADSTRSPKIEVEVIAPMSSAPDGEATAAEWIPSEPTPAAVAPEPTDLSAGRAEPQTAPRPLPARAAAITSSDDALAELIEKFAPDSGFLRGGLHDPKPV